MTIQLNEQELTTLVENHIASLGFSGNLNVAFSSKNKITTVDTSIEILTVSQVIESIEEDETTVSEPQVSTIDALIK